MGILYIVATPIGNLGDVTRRAAETLNKVHIIACEDTRRTGLLLKEIASVHNKLVYYTESALAKKPSLLSYYEQNELERIPQIIGFLKNDNDVALVSDAGMPTISDPGFKLVRECVREGIRVEVIPGPSSVITALAVSGLPTDKFLFLGYPPRKPGHRKTVFENTRSTTDIMKATVIFFEAPHRLLQLLDELLVAFGDIDIVLCRELTKVHEEVRREKISEAMAHFKKVEPRGEFVILFHRE